MKKYLIISIFTFFCFNQSYAKTFIWTCLKSETKDFQLVFKINDSTKTIEHLTSYNYSIKKNLMFLRKIQLSNLMRIMLGVHHQHLKAQEL